MKGVTSPVFMTAVKIILVIGVIVGLMGPIAKIIGKTLPLDFDMWADVDTKEACEAFDNHVWTREYFFREVTGGNTLEEKIKPYIPRDTNDTYWDARKLCGAGIGLINAVDDGELEKIVPDINRVYDREFRGAGFTVEEISAKVDAENRREVWIPEILIIVQKKLWVG